jgi:ATP adenylyltransferase
MNRLWAPWRMSYVTGATPTTGCVFCLALAGDDDRRVLVVRRGRAAFLILNAYPYAAGHLMAVINRHVGRLEHAEPHELTEAMTLVQQAVTALRREYRPDGFNIGINQGRVAGAGIDEHLHVHVVPRWNGDTNFMPVMADTKVLPETLDATWKRLHAALGEQGT